MSATCCFCIKLRTGCLIIAYFYLIMEMISLSGSIGLLLFRNAVMARIKVAAGPHWSKAVERDARLIYSIVFTVIILFVSIALIFTVSLLIGIYRKKRGCIKAYIVFHSICLALSYLFFITTFFLGSFGSNFVSNVISLVINTYFLVVIINYKKIMYEEEETETEPEPQTKATIMKF